jgi:hypothetical protein
MMAFRTLFLILVTDFDFGLLRWATAEEEDAGYDQVFEHLSSSGDNYLGAKIYWKIWSMQASRKIWIFYVKNEFNSPNRLMLSRSLGVRRF